MNDSSSRHDAIIRICLFLNLGSNFFDSMRFNLVLLLSILTTTSFSQDTIRVSKVDTPINFFGLKPLRLHPYNNRVVPFDSYNPLYVLITYENGKNKNFEYFRVDSTTYLVYEFFKSAKGSSNEGLKSSGIMKVTNQIAGISTTGVRHLGSIDNNYTKEIHYYRALSKEGEWDEYEDSVFNHIYWTGKYLNNRRVGLWKRIIYGIGDEFTFEEVDYDKDSTKKIYSANIAKTILTDSIKKMLVGRWSLRDCDAENEPRMFYLKCETYNGEYGDDCNDRIDRDNYYDFISSTRFVRQRGEGCYNFRETCTRGQWKIIEKGGERFIEMKFDNGRTWRLKILYLDYENNLITDRQ